MKTILTAIAIVMASFITFNLNAQQGTLDSTFNGNGIQILTPTALHNNGYAVVIQPDSSIVFAGMSTISSLTGFDFCVGRLHPDGTVDSTFGTNGYVLYDHKGFTDYCYDVLLQPDGKILAVGAVSLSPANTEFFVMRLNTNGSLDSSFAGDGRFVIPYTTGEEYAKKALLQPDGKIILGGYTVQGPTDYAVLVRVNSNGTVDSSFGNFGFAVSNFQQSELIIENLILRPNGHIVCAGVSTNGTTQAAHAFGFTQTGLVDQVFGTNGLVTFSGAYSVKGITEFNNTIYVCGSGGSAASPIGYVYALNDTGNLIPYFGTSGLITATLNQGISYNAIKVQPDGKLIVGGGSLIGFLNSEFIVSRFYDNGNLDSAFGVNGHAAYDLGGQTSQNLLGLATQPDGKIVGIGTKMVGNHNAMAFVVLTIYFHKKLH